MKLCISMEKEKDKVETKTNHAESTCPAILLSVVQAEYDLEREISKSIDAKTMALLTIILALITVYVPIIPTEKLVALYSKGWDCFLVPTIGTTFILCGVAAMALSIKSAIALIEIYRAKEYKAVDIMLFNSDQILAASQAGEFQIELINHYQGIIFHNSEVNLRKAKKLNKQFYAIVAVFILLTIAAIGTTICVGI